MIDVHAAPNTHPAGVHGALFRLLYQSDEAPLSVNKLPNASAKKLSTRNKMMFMNIINFYFKDNFMRTYNIGNII